jgi:cystathionine beta-lyase/cystathionine gamma-synthase
MTARGKKSSPQKPGTKLVHAGAEEQETAQPAVTPIYRATTYRMSPDIYRGIRKYSQTKVSGTQASQLEVRKLRNSFFYARDANPNVAVVQRKMAALEGCQDGVATSSGMGAITSTILSVVKGKKYIVSTPHLYGSSFFFLFKELREMFGIKIIRLKDFLSKRWQHKIDGEDVAAVYVESLSNPLLVFAPLDEIRNVRDELCPMTPIIVDNTLLTPINLKVFRVLDPKRDVALYSATKYLGGHSDVIAGIVCGSSSMINGVWEKMTLYGCCLDAESAYYLERGLKTLHIRMEKHNQNLHEVFKYLTAVSGKFGIKIFHPLTGQNPIPNFAKQLVKQKRLGGMIAFHIEGKREKDGIRFMDILHEQGVIQHAPSLGGVESLISMPCNTSQPTREQQKLLGLDQYGCLLRLSTGIEDAGDIINSLDTAFTEICRRP